MLLTFATACSKCRGSASFFYDRDNLLGKLPGKPYQSFFNTVCHKFSGMAFDPRRGSSINLKGLALAELNFVRRIRKIGKIYGDK